MKKVLILVVAVFCAVTLSCIKKHNETTFDVIRVVDGDTIQINMNGTSEYVRFLRIDTPERGNELYQAAGDALAALIGSSKIRLEYEIDGCQERDKYNRILAYVWAGDVNTNLELVRQGYSAFYKVYGLGKYKEQFQAAEDEAKAAKRGIWKGASMIIQ